MDPYKGMEQYFREYWQAKIDSPRFRWVKLYIGYCRGSCCGPSDTEHPTSYQIHWSTLACQLVDSWPGINGLIYTDWQSMQCLHKLVNSQLRRQSSVNQVSTEVGMEYQSTVDWGWIKGWSRVGGRRELRQANSDRLRIRLIQGIICGYWSTLDYRWLKHTGSEYFTSLSSGWEILSDAMIPWSGTLFLISLIIFFNFFSAEVIDV